MNDLLPKDCYTQAGTAATMFEFMIEEISVLKFEKKEKNISAFPLSLSLFSKYPRDFERPNDLQQHNS